MGGIVARARYEIPHGFHTRMEIGRGWPSYQPSSKQVQAPANWSPRRSSPAITHRFARFRADWLWLASNWAPIIRSILTISFDPSGIHRFPTINLLIDSRSQWVDCEKDRDFITFFIVIIISRCEMILIGYRLNEESTVLLFVSGRRDHSRG